MLHEAFAEFWSLIKEEGLGLSAQIFDMEERPHVSRIIEAMASPGFFGTFRLGGEGISGDNWIIIKNAHSLKARELQTISSEMHALRKVGAPEKIGSVTGKTHCWAPRLLFLWKSKFDKKIEDLLPDTTFISVTLQENEIPKWIHYKARKLGLRLTEDAMQYIIEHTMGEPGIISSELQKIRSADVLSPSIEDLKQIISSNYEYDIRDLYSALRSRDKGKTLCAVNSLKDELIQVVGVFNQFYSNRPEYKEILPLLHEMDIRTKSSGGYLEPLILKLLDYAT